MSEPNEIAPDFWHWTAPHPEWSPDEVWQEAVSSYAAALDDYLLLFDPLAVPADILEMGQDRQTVIVLTCPWHERDTEQLVDDLGASVYAPAPDSADDLIEKFGITREQAGDGSPDLAWLRARPDVSWHRYGHGDELLAGIVVFAGREHNDMVLWLPEHRALLSGDTLVDFGDGFGIASWLRADVTRDEVVERLAPLLDMPVEHMLTTHGGPVDSALLPGALA
jgi:hypothetical protein